MRASFSSPEREEEQHASRLASTTPSLNSKLVALRRRVTTQQGRALYADRPGADVEPDGRNKHGLVDSSIADDFDNSTPFPASYADSCSLASYNRLAQPPAASR